MSKFEIIELILMYTAIWTLLAWVCMGLVAFVIWLLVFKIFNNDTPKFQDVDRKFFGGYQPKEFVSDMNNNPPDGPNGGN
ncbi:hypothetical protein M9Y90_05410 [Leptospira interrogans]|uniref:hypothetical protein n=1 Tax=Leptospira interrogans TaxID=173 RepID=UPI001F4C69A1|nr:hypothetical protein [Leptospira interrogans]MCL8310114.1 hypothetical protein [Leptospira interrogans]UNE66904.1 hypothetical protein FH588_20745 [Leptospira interrogans]